MAWGHIRNSLARVDMGQYYFAGRKCRANQSPAARAARSNWSLYARLHILLRMLSYYISWHMK